ncbi:MAG: hypothetical protein WCO45_11750, partial [Pseudanabaena sp. ELA607]
MKLLQQWRTFWTNLMGTRPIGVRSKFRGVAIEKQMRHWGLMTLLLLLLINPMVHLPWFNSAQLLAQPMTNPVHLPNNMIAQTLPTGQLPTGRTEQLFTPILDPFLTAGKLAEAETKFTTYLSQFPQDDKARFSLGVVQLLRGVERLSQSFYRYGLRRVGNGMGLPFMRLPIPDN